MSVVPNNRSQLNTATSRALNRIANTYIHSDSINEASPTRTPVGDDHEQSSTWVDSLAQLDRLFSGGLLRFCYNLIDIILLSLGLHYGTRTCSVSNALAIVSICILVFASIALALTLIFVIKNWSVRHRTLADEETARRYRQGYALRSFFYFLKFICVCVGMAYTFTSKRLVNKDCEIVRFCLGIVCFNIWVLISMWPPKPSLPTRRSLILECFLLILSIIFNSIYFGFVAFATIRTHESKCVYSRIEDLYFDAPLKSFGYIGLILIGCLVIINIIVTILNQLYFCLPNWRKLFVYLSAIHYMICYAIMVVLVYYFSVGAVLLFRPRSGGSCRIVAPNLYKTLWIWQLIRVFLPVFIWPLSFLVRCRGVAFGTCLAQYLPAPITVPLVEMLQERLPDNPGVTNSNPPVSPDTIEALPKVVFGQVSDEFNQTQCSICRTDHQVNEEGKRLPCGHLFHSGCVSTWLAITHICPVCRQRITSASL